MDDDQKDVNTIYGMSEGLHNEYNLDTIEKIKFKRFEMFITRRHRYRYIQKEYEPFSSEIVANYIKPNSTFVDIGAHYGYYSLLAHSSQDNVKIIAVEPVEENFAILNKNLRLNNIKNYELHNVAASDKAGVADFNITDASDSAGFYKHPGVRAKKIVKIKTVRLDDILKGQKIDFIKIDVEGHEVPVLSGLSETIKNNKDVMMLIEFNPKCLKSANYREKDFFKTLNDLGFECFLIDESKGKYHRLHRDGSPWQQLMRGMNASYANVLCINKKKALLVSFVSHSSNLFGSERALSDIVTRIRENGALVHIIFPTDGPVVETIKSKAISYDIDEYYWWTTSDDRVHKMCFKSMVRLFMKLYKINPHVIVSNTIVVPWGALLALALNKPHVWYVHEFGLRDFGFVFKIGFKYVMRFMELLSDFIIYNSKAVKLEFERHINWVKSEVIYFTINIPESLLMEEVGDVYKSKNSLKLIMLGLITQSKGQEQAIRAVIDLVKEGHDVELLVVGQISETDKYQTSLRNTVEKSGIKAIRFIDFTANPFPYIKQTDILLMCSRCEAFGRVTVEGMMLGKPIIGANTGGTAELIEDGFNGLLYEYNNVESLKDKIRFFIHDRNQVKTFGGNASNFARINLHFKNCVRDVYDILIRVKNERRCVMIQVKRLIGLQLLLIKVFLVKVTGKIRTSMGKIID